MSDEYMETEEEFVTRRDENGELYVTNVLEAGITAGERIVELEAQLKQARVWSWAWKQKVKEGKAYLQETIIDMVMSYTNQLSRVEQSRDKAIAERDALQKRITAMQAEVKRQRDEALIRYRGFPNAIATAQERLDYIRDAGQETK